MNKIFLVAITVGVLLIAGIVTFNFIQQQIQAQKERRIANHLSNYTLRNEWDKKMDLYVNESLACGQTIKKCFDDAWKKNDLGIPKYDVVDGDIK
jgi:uncharacterized protein HemX